MRRKNELYIDGYKYGLVKDHINDFGLYEHFKNTVHLFDGTIQHTDEYGHKLYLKKENDKWVTTTDTTALPYMYPKVVEPDTDELVNVFLLENKRKFFAYPVGECGREDSAVIGESSIELYSELISFCLENKYKYLGLLDTMFKDYDPISNYDSYEKRTDTHGDETFTHTPIVDSGHTVTTSTPAETTTTTSPNGELKTSHYTTTYDDASQGRLADYTVQEGGTNSSTHVDNNGVTDTMFNSEEYTDTKTITSDGYELERHGNIGVTSTQDMLEQERNIRRFSVLKEFCKELGNYICLSVY